jgi:hypothetical protein
MQAFRPGEWKVILIVEDDSDGQALRLLAQASGVPCQIDWVPANGLGNIKRRGLHLIRLARDRICEGQGCVAVLVDRDGRDASRDEPHRSIRNHCKEAGVPYLEAVEAFEAWCLADPGICQWLGLRTPACADVISNPKDRVAQAYRKKAGRSYEKRRARTRLARNARGVEARRSPSWKAATEKLDLC